MDDPQRVLGNPSGAARRRLAAGVAVLVLVLGIAGACKGRRGKVYVVVNPQAPRGEWQREPLPGAFVTLSWTFTIPGPGHAVDMCRYSELARTDDGGEYVMEGPDPVTANLAHVSSYVYFPGLERIDFPYPRSPVSPQDMTMTFRTRTPENRLSYLALLTEPGCPDRKLSDPRALLVPYLRALLDEAKALEVDSDSGRRYVEQIDAMLRHAAGLDRPQRLRVIVSPGRVVVAPLAPRSGPPVQSAPDAGR